MSEPAPAAGPAKRRLIFPPWFDKFVRLFGLVVAGGPVYVVLLATYAGSVENTMVGYQPGQPVAYSHAVHVGELGMDCRYCHTTVEKAASRSSTESGTFATRFSGTTTNSAWLA